MTEARIAALQAQIAELEAENEALRQKNRLETQQPDMFKTVVDSLPDGIGVNGLDGRFIYVNPALAEMTGYTKAELETLRITDIIADGHYDSLEEIITAVMEQGNWIGESAYVRKDGSTFPGQVSATVLHDSEGTPIGTIGAVRDITRVHEQRAFLQQIIDAIPGLLAVKNREGVFTMVNQRIVDVYGTTHEELIGKTDADFSPSPEEVEYFWQKDREAMDRKEMVFIPEETVTSATGETRYYQTTKVPLVNEEGEADHILVVATDIHERKLAEEENERLRREIIETQQQALQELSTPIIPLLEGVVVVPLIGTIDTARAKDIMRSLLRSISEYRARTVIIDITGVPVVDSGVANHLDKTIQATRLKGARAIITGISDAVAETIVDMGIDWSELETVRNLQSGLVMALQGAAKDQ